MWTVRVAGVPEKTYGVMYQERDHTHTGEADWAKSVQAACEVPPRSDAGFRLVLEV
jgi:hypothetical protein